MGPAIPGIGDPHSDMSILRTTLLVLLLALPLATVAIAWAVLSDRATVDRPVAFTPAHVERAREILRRHDPRWLPVGVPRTVQLAVEDVDLALNYLSDRHAGASARVVLRAGTAVLTATLPVPPNPLGRFLDVTMVLREGATLPVVESMRLGRLPVPIWLARPVFDAALRRLLTPEGYRVAVEAVRKVAIADRGLAVTYVWQDDLTSRLQAELVPAAEQARLRAHHERLAAIVGATAPGRPIGLDALLGPLLRFAAQRSQAGDPVAENRAAILVAAFYANGRGLQVLVPAARGWRSPAPRAVTLAGREDLAKHFAVSAAIAAHAGVPLSDAIGLYKELEDSRGGSGFAFDDLVADRAGTRFGELAAGDRASAAELQRRFAAGLGGVDLLPPVNDLPGPMPKDAFERRFGGVDSPAYRRVMEDVERRIAALPLYR